MTNSALLTFVATFGGVIASFLLWFSGSAFIKWRENQKILKSMMPEILIELRFNIGLVISTMQYLGQCLQPNGDVPLLISRLKYSAMQYAVSSGEVRLIRNIRKRRIVEYAAISCEAYNRFAENTERLLATLLLRADGLVWARHRIEGMAEQAAGTKSILEGYLSKLEQEDLPEDDGGHEMDKTNDPPQMGNEEKLLSKVEENNKLIVRMMKSQKRDSLISIGAVVLAIWGIAFAIKSSGTTEAVRGAGGLFFLGVQTWLTALAYLGNGSNKKVFDISSLKSFFTQLRNEPKEIVFTIGGIVSIVGSGLLMFSDVSANACILVAIVGILGVVLSTFIAKKNQN